MNLSEAEKLVCNNHIPACPFHKLLSEIFMHYVLVPRNCSTVCIPEITCRGISPICFSLFSMLAYSLIIDRTWGFFFFFLIYVFPYIEIHVCLKWNKPNTLTAVLTFMLEKVQACKLLQSKSKGQSQPLTQKGTFKFRLNQLKMQGKICLQMTEFDLQDIQIFYIRLS